MFFRAWQYYVCGIFTVDQDKKILLPINRPGAYRLFIRKARLGWNGISADVIVAYEFFCDKCTFSGHFSCLCSTFVYDLAKWKGRKQ